MTEALSRAQRLGFLGDGDVSHHIAHSSRMAGCAQMVLADREVPRTEALRFLDLGSGGGVPGLVLCALWPEATGVLLDANGRKTQFLLEVVSELQWKDRVDVICARAEDAGREAPMRHGFSLVVARAFGAPAVTAECGAPFLELGGLLVVSEPPPGGSGPAAQPSDEAGRGLARAELGPSDPTRWPEGPLRQLGLMPLGRCAGSFSFQVLHQSELCPPRFPRRTGMPAKRPLYRAA